MKVKTKTATDDDYREAFVVEVDGTEEMSFIDGEPEDNSLGRNFNDIFGVAGLMERAFLAGKAGESIIFEYEEVDWDDL